MKKILIIGATSSIAEHAARIWAKQGAEFFLTGRNQERLEIISNDLLARGAKNAFFYPLDVNKFSSQELMLNNAFDDLGSVDIALIAHGTLPNQKKCEHSIDATLLEINTNAISTIALLTDLANRFEKQGCGTIAVISSVAGDRGRQSNYIYGCSKAMVSTFMSGLRQRLNGSGISVLTIKPGFVDTPMTAQFKKGALWASPNQVASTIILACEKRNGVIYVPGFWWGIMTVIKLLPEFIFKKIKL